MPTATYLNPVYNHSFPDPFVLKFCGEYWAYCTGMWTDYRCFGILRSPDLVHWTEVGGALAPLPGDHPCYWAPEVSYWNGTFYLYYSVGNETFMQIRVAVANHPAGPFIDSGHRLTSEDFAIDPHVFEDDDGTRYLFYATDYLTYTYIGTGTARDRMLDPFTLAGQPQPVTRARYDWQVYDPQRHEKGGVRWHTVEGPFVLKHNGLYYQMFSGGNWQNVSYGVSYAVTDDILRPEDWDQAADGEHVLPILRTVPGQVIGPGHNSIMRGPDNRQLFCVYHRWSDDDRERVMCIDRLDFVDDRIVVDGPSLRAQPAPALPAIGGFGSDTEQGLGADWACVSGEWRVRDGIATQSSSAGSGGAQRSLLASNLLLEVSLRALNDPSERGAYGISLYNDSGPALAFTLQPSDNQGMVAWHSGDEWAEVQFALPTDFDAHAYHLLRVELNTQYITLALDQTTLWWQGQVGLQPRGLALRTHYLAAAFAGLTLTVT